jgi:hypothetical protein
MRKALSLVSKREDTSKEFGAFLWHELANFQRRHPRFAMEQVVDHIYEAGPASWPSMDTEFTAIGQECLRAVAQPPIVDFLRDTDADAYNALLEAMAEDNSIVGDTLDHLPPVRAKARRAAWRNWIAKLRFPRSTRHFGSRT